MTPTDQRQSARARGRGGDRLSDFDVQQRAVSIPSWPAGRPSPPSDAANVEEVARIFHKTAADPDNARRRGDGGRSRRRQLNVHHDAFEVLATRQGGLPKSRCQKRCAARASKEERTALILAAVQPAQNRKVNSCKKNT